MKNLNRRTKMLVAIAGILIVLIAVGFVVLGPSQEGLFGSDVIHISPENPTINVYDNIDMSINAVFNKCSWSTTDESVLQLWNFNSDYSRKIQVMGLKAGKATVKANCAMDRYTTVTVRPQPVIIPANFTVKVGQSITVTTDGKAPTCKWSVQPLNSSHVKIQTGNGTVGATAVVVGIAAGSADVQVWDCPNGQNRTNVSVVP